MKVYFLLHEYILILSHNKENIIVSENSVKIILDTHPPLSAMQRPNFCSPSLAMVAFPNVIE